MKRFVLLLTLLSSSVAFAELPPPGTARKGKITVDPNNKGTPSEYDLQNQKVINRADARRVQKKIDALRARIAELEGENSNLRNATQNAPRSLPIIERAEPTVERVEPESNKKNRISAIVGYGPASLTNQRRESDLANEIEIEYSPIVGAQYQRLFGDTFSVGAQVTFPTVPDTKKGSYSILGGLDF